MNRLVTAFFVLAAALSSTFARVSRHADAHHPRYAYKYWVNDPVTKDIKQHWEARDGDLVKGSYSLVEPDGKLRVVDYWADDAHGFNADVKRTKSIVESELNPASIPNTVPTEAEPAPPGQKDPVKPLTPSTNYGFGSIGSDAPQLHTSVGFGSLPWDPKTGSYGGWVPRRSAEPQATIFSKKYVDGRLHRLAIGPISLSGRTLVFKVKHRVTD